MFKNNIILSTAVLTLLVICNSAIAEHLGGVRSPSDFVAPGVPLSQAVEFPRHFPQLTGSSNSFPGVPLSEAVKFNGHFQDLKGPESSNILHGVPLSQAVKFPGHIQDLKGSSNILPGVPLSQAVEFNGHFQDLKETSNSIPGVPLSQAVEFNGHFKELKETSNSLPGVPLSQAVEFNGHFQDLKESSNSLSGVPLSQAVEFNGHFQDLKGSTNNLPGVPLSQAVEFNGHFQDLKGSPNNLPGVPLSQAVEFDGHLQDFKESSNNLIFSKPIIEILRDNREEPQGGNYFFEFETADGIKRQENGHPHGPNGAVVQQGSWSFTFPDGSIGQFSFIADENGYRPVSPLIHPLPPHAIAQIEKAQREDSEGHRFISSPTRGTINRGHETDFQKNFEESFQSVPNGEISGIPHKQFSSDTQTNYYS